MKRMLSVLSTAASIGIGALAVACGDDGGSPSPTPARFACDNRAIESTCAEFAPGVTTSDDAKRHCDGALVEAPCPLDRAIATCTVESTAYGPLTNTYYSNGPSPWTDATASEACLKALGSFRPR